MSVNVKFKTLEDLSRYANQLGKAVRRYLLPINVGVSIGCCTCAEIIEQKFIEKRKHLNFRRILSFGCCGFLSGFTGTFWYLWSGKRIVGKYRVLKQLLMYQLVFTPYEYVQFYMSVGLLEGESLKEVINEMKSKFMVTYVMDCIVFPPFMIINFKLIPLRFRFLYDNCIQLMWCVFLSFLKHHNLNKYIDTYVPTLILSKAKDGNTVE